MRRLLFVATWLFAFSASADQDEYVFDAGIGPRVQLLSAERVTRTFNTSSIDWPSPYLGIRYGLTDFATYGALEVGVGAQYAAQADAKYSNVEWDPKKHGNVLENYESWNVGVETRVKYGVVYIPYLLVSAGWHRLAIYDIDFITLAGLRIAHYKSHLAEMPYIGGGLGFEWRFSNRWSANVEGLADLDLGESSNQFAFPMRFKFSYYLPD